MAICYARARELGPWLDQATAKGEIFVRLWLGPGERAAAFEVGDDPLDDPIPAELKLFS